MDRFITRETKNRGRQIMTAYRHQVSHNGFRDDDGPEPAASLKAAESWEDWKGDSKVGLTTVKASQALK